MLAVLGVATLDEREILRQCLEEEGFSTVVGRDVSQVREACERQRPWLLVIDLDWFAAGFEAFWASRHAADYPHVLLLAPLGQEARVTHYLLLGGDDMLFNNCPVDLFRLKLQQFKHLENLQRRLAALDDGRSADAPDLSPATLVRRHSTNIRHLFSPTGRHSSNLFLVANASNGSQFVLAGDLSGCSASSGRLAACLADTYFEHLSRSENFSDLLCHLDAVVAEHLPESSVPALLIESSLAQGRLRWYSGGLPAALLWREERGELEVLSAQHQPLGMIGRKCACVPAECPLRADDLLYHYTAGLLDVCGDAKRDWGAPELRACLFTSPASKRFDSVKAKVDAFLLDGQPRADISFAEIAPFDRRGSVRAVTK